MSSTTSFRTKILRKLHKPTKLAKLIQNQFRKMKEPRRLETTSSLNLGRGSPRSPKSNLMAANQSSISLIHSRCDSKEAGSLVET